MRTLLISTFIALVVTETNGQTWKYESGGNPFDGKYKTSSVVGIGDEFPYNKPVFVINVFRDDVINPNIYLTSVPYAGCDNRKVQVVFDDEDKIYSFSTATDNENETWFLKFSSNSVKWDSKNNVWTDVKTDSAQLHTFLNEVKTRSKMHVRLTSDCVKYDCVFNLKGSTAAINYVLRQE